MEFIERRSQESINNKNNDNNRSNSKQRQRNGDEIAGVGSAKKSRGTKTLAYFEDLEEDYYYENESTVPKVLPDPTKYKFSKRVVQRPPAKKNDIYVSRNSHSKAQFKHAFQLLEDLNFRCVNIHGLGAAINEAIALALELKEKFELPLRIHCTTSTVKLVDDYEPLADDIEPLTQIRYNSAIHINISVDEKGPKRVPTKTSGGTRKQQQQQQQKQPQKQQGKQQKQQPNRKK